MLQRYPAHYFVTAILAVGLASMLFATIKLQSIFLAESNRNTEFLNQRRLGIENYAAQQLGASFSQEIDKAINEISRIVDNPLLETGNHFWLQRGEQQIPRPIFYQLAKDFSASDYYRDLMQASNTNRINNDWSSEKNQIWKLTQAIVEDDEVLVEKLIREIIAKNHQHDENIQEFIAFRLATIAIFSTYKKSSSVLIEKLLRDNLVGEFGANLPGLQKQLLNLRMEFTEPDFKFLSDKLIELSKKNNTRTADFLELSHKSFELPNISDMETNTTIIVDETWLIESQGINVFGTKIDLSAALEKVRLDMAKLGLISHDDVLTLKLGQGSSISLENIAFEWRSENWQQAVDDSRQFDVIKRIILFAGLITVFAVIFLVAWIYRYQARWINSKSDFVATVSHEIRTPLSGIRLMAERLADKFSGDERAKDYPQRIISDIDALSFLTDNILSFERLNSGNWISHKSPINVRELFYELERDLPLFVKQDFQLSVSGDSNTQIYGDPVLIKLFFSNLLKNSCLYNKHAQAIVQVSWETKAGDVFVSLKDNGIGFPKNEVNDCFKPFYRGHNQRHTRGSGLGLALCKKIIELHDGKISIVSSSDAGTHFLITCRMLNSED